MRPIRLEFTGFTCFRTPQTIELGDLTLFAISGPTGAGKTSILDAMTLALYGQTPRSGGKNVWEFVSLGALSATVTLTFDLSGDRYTVRRSLPRTGQAKATLDKGSTNLVSGPDAVKNKVTELLGMDVENFNRAVVLPQGEFARFIQASVGDQKKILRELLRLGVYDRMRQEAASRSKLAANAEQNLNRRLEEDFAGVSAAALVEREAELARVSARLVELGPAVDVARSAVNTAEKLLRELEEHARLTRQRDALSIRSGEIVEGRARLKLAERSARAWPAVEASRAAQKTEEAAKRASDAAVKDAAATSQRRAAALAARLEADVAAEVVPALNERRDALVRAVAQGEALTAQLAEARTRRSPLGDAAGALVRARLAHEAAVTALAERVVLRDAITREPALPELRARVGAAERLRGARVRLDTARRDRRAAETLGPAVAGEEAARAALHVATTAREAAEVEHTRATDALAALERAHAAEALRVHLVKGEPCPVCTHVFAGGDLPVGVVGREPAPGGGLLDAARRVIEGARLAHVAAVAAERRAEQAHAKLATDRSLAERAVEQAAAMVVSLDAELAEADRAFRAGAEDAPWLAALLVHREGGPTLEERHGQALLAAELSEKVWNEADRLVGDARDTERAAASRAERASQDASVAQTLDATIEELGARRDQLHAELGGDPGPQLVAVKERVAALLRASEEARASAERAEAAHRDAEARVAGKAGEHLAAERAAVKAGIAAAEALGDHGFADVAACEGGRLDASLERELKKRIEAWDRDTAELVVRLQDLHDAIGGRTITAEDNAAVRAILTALEADRDVATAAAGRLTLAVETLHTRLADATRLRAEVAEAQGKRRLFEALARDLDLHAFQAHLVRATFQDLVDAASERLFGLSSGRYRLQLGDDKEPISVIDIENASLIRPAKTLSGGETFLASLALALELSEQVQRSAGAVRLDSLFIDEGFGTLDAETLETVAGAIETLSEANRTIGIITHVPELSERLPARLVVSRGVAGSNVEVVRGTTGDVS